MPNNKQSSSNPRESFRISEDTMLSAIFKLMTAEEIEASEREFRTNDGSRPKVIDLFAKKGISGLGINGPTYIEFKFRLLVNSYQDISRQARRLVALNPDSYFLTIYVNSDVIVPEDKNGHIRFYEFSWINQEAENNGNKDNVPNPEVEKLSPEERNDKQIRELIETLKTQPTTLFLGTGISIDAGAPTWAGLLKMLLARNEKLYPQGLDENGFDALSKSLGDSLLVASRYILGKDINKDELPNQIHPFIYQRNLGDYKVNSPSLPVLAKIIKDADKIQSVITFNYDEFLEYELGECGCRYAPFHQKGALKDGELPIYHVHGYVPLKKPGGSKFITLAEDDYHTKYANCNHWSNIEIQHALIRTSCIFIGLSMTDPNLRRLIDYAKQEDDGEIRHYLIIMRPQLDSKVPNKKADDLHLERLEEMYKDMGINLIWYEPYLEKQSNTEKPESKHKNLCELLTLIHNSIKYSK